MSSKENKKNKTYDQLPQIFSGKLRSLYKLGSKDNNANLKSHHRSLSLDLNALNCDREHKHLSSMDTKQVLRNMKKGVPTLTCDTDKNKKFPPCGILKTTQKDHTEDKGTYLEVHYCPLRKKSPVTTSSNYSGSRDESPGPSSPSSPLNLRRRMSELGLPPCPEGFRRNSMESRPSRHSSGLEERARTRKFRSEPNSPNMSPAMLRKKRTSVPNVLLHKRIVEYPITENNHNDHQAENVHEKKIKEILHKGDKKSGVREYMSADTFERCKKWLTEIENARHERGLQELVQPIIHWQESD